MFKTECIRTTVLDAGPYRTAGGVEFATARLAAWYKTGASMAPSTDLTPVEFEHAHTASMKDPRESSAALVAEPLMAAP